MALQDFGSLSLTNTPTGAQDKAPGLGTPRRGGTTPLDAATVDRIIAEEGADAIKPTVLGIYGQESSGGTNARRSIDGAIGGMQVIPGTFNRIAKPGERIDNPEDNFRVGVRLLKTMADKFGNDPARLAVGYFSGEGNIATGGDTPYKNDYRDGNGKSVSSYARDLVARVGNAVVPSAKAAEPAPDISKAPKYRDFIAKPQWASLDDTQKEQARNAYFDRYVAPHLPAAQRDGQRDAFLRRAAEIEGPALAAPEQPGLMSRAVDAIGRGLATLGGSPERLALDQAATAQPAPAQNKIGVMGTAPAPVAPNASRAPVTPEFRTQVQRAYDAATPAEREQMAKADGVIGQLARERAGIKGATTDTGRLFDTTAEGREARMRAGGVDPTAARNFAQYGAATGQTPGTELGTASASNFDFEAQQAFNKGPLSHPLIRAAVKGYEGYRAGSLGLAQALFDATGNEEFADIARGGIEASQRRTAAIGEKGDGLQRNFEGAVSSIAQQLPALLAGVATGTQVVPLAAMFTQTFGQEYGQGRAQGLDGAQAATRAGIFGAFEVLGERFGLGQTLQALKMAGKGAATQDIATVLAKGLVREIPGEQLTTLGQFLTDKVPGIGTNLEAGLAEYLKQAGDTLAQTVMQGGLMMGGTTGVSAGVRHLQGVQSQQSQTLAAEQARENALNKAAAFGQPVRPKHDSQVAAEQVVREMAAEAGMNADDLLPPERTVPPAPAAVPAPPAAPAALDQSDAADIAGLSDAVLAAEAAQGAVDEGQPAVPAATVDPRSAAPDAGMAVDPAAGSAGVVPSGDGAGAGTAPAGVADAAAVPGADGATDGQPALDNPYRTAVDVVRGTRSPAVSIIQRHLRTDYNTAAGLLERMERDGIVSAPNERGVRSVLEQAPAATPLDAAAHEAATSPANDLPEPTDAQKAAGNYKMGHTTLQGLDLTIENPRGSQRSGKDADGKAWSVDMAHHYGYIKRTEGADGDHVDAFIGPNPDSAQVFVVDQVDPRTGKFDEHKVMLGFDSLEAARDGYLANYEQGWKGAAAVTPMSMDEFKTWLKDGDTTKPLNPKVGKPRTETQARAAREQAKPQAPVDNQARADLDAALSDLGDILGAKPAATAGHDKPLAGPGLNSYRYKGQYGWIMLGATDRADALREAARSTDGAIDPDNLQRWDGERYVDAKGAPPAKPKTERALKEERAAKKRTGAQAARDKLKAENPFLAFIGEFGLNPKDRKDLGQEKGQRAIPGFGFVWRNSAPRIDELALLAMESGFLSRDDIDAAGDTGGTRKLAEMIQRAMVGEVEQTHDTAIDAARARQEAEYQEYLLQQQEAEQEAADERDAILYAERAAFDILDDADIPFDLTTTTDPGNLTDDEIDRLFGLQAESRGGIQEGAAAPARASAGNPAAPARAGPGSRKEKGLTQKGKKKTEKQLREERAQALADYFTPGNVVKSYGGHHEILAFEPGTIERPFAVTVQEVRKEGDEWVRVGKPQDARTHGTTPSARELESGPVDRVPDGEARYTEPRSDGQPFSNAPRRGPAPTEETADDAPLLTSYSADEIRAQEGEREAAAKAEAKAKREADERARREQEQKELGDRRRQDASAENFQLGQDPMEALSGQADIFGTPAAAPAREESAEMRKARADLDAALGDLGDLLGASTRLNITPEQEQKLLPVMTRLFDAAFRLGYYKFKQSARFVLDTVRDKFGDDVAGMLNLDYLQAGYISMAGRYQDQGADSKRDVINVESLNEITENDDVSAAGGISQQGGQQSDAEGSVDTAPVRNGSAATERDAGAAGEGTAGGRRAWQGGGVVPGAGAAPGGERGDQPVFGADGQFGDGETPTRSGNGRGSRSTGGSGVQSGAGGNAATEADAERARRLSRDEKLAAQRAAESVPVVVGDRANIDATLPFLNEGQREDLHFGETRFQKPDGYGVLYTNGTGTGKTFLGLGFIKRMVKQGKGNGVIVAPNEAVIAGWVASAKDLGLTVTPLESTKEAGRGVAITTYANFATNPTLADRDYDFVVIDEAQELMKSKDANETGALAALRAITLHPGGTFTRAKMQHRDLLAKIEPLRKEADELRKTAMRTEAQNADLAKLEAKIKPLQAEYDAAVEKVKAHVEASQNATRPRTLFLSATPFAYEQNIDWAAGYLFSYPQVTSRGYNTPSPYGAFMIQHFGWRMRTGKLTEPDAKVDRNIMQRQFNTWLRREGVLSARMLDVDADYDRKFVLVKEGIGSKIDEGLKWLREADGGRFQPLYAVAMARFDYLNRQRLLEAIKAEDSIEYIRAQHALGRKVIVFYEYNQGGGFSPFQFTEGSDDETVDVRQVIDGRVEHSKQNLNELIRAFRKERPDLAAIDTGRLASPLATLTKAFPQAGVYNGMAEYKKTRMAALAAFNSDDRPDANLLLVQAAANAGWSGHDTTGKFQRVLINLGLPTAPTKAIQQEGRIYRVGQVSDALFRYFNTGTAWERSTFAGTIARRASTAENLAMGEQARALLTSFVDAFEASDTYPPSTDEGRGGKAGDRAMLSALTDYDRARAFYFGQQKKTARTKAAEGADYFATPEPVGAKMVEWLGAREGDSLLEPSAGHGAIARWMPDNTARTVVEPSMELASRLALVTDAKLVNDTFESLNIVNKFDGIAMNPPFGVGGKLAIEHLDKAYRHLREGGRIVALIPTGPAADKRFDAWYYEEGVEEKARQRGAARLLADIRLPGVTFERAGTSVATRIVVIDKVSDDSVPTPLPRHIDLSDAADVNELFDRLQDIDMGPRAPRAEAAAAPVAPAAAPAEQPGQVAAYGETPTYAVRDGKLVTNAPWATYTTEKGKELRGVYVLDRETAKSVDQFTFRPKGQAGFFVREKHVVRPAAETPVMARTPASAGGVSADSLRAMIAPIQAQWANGPKGGVEVVQSVDDLPPHLAEYMRSAEGASEQGFYLPKSDKVFLIADNLPSLERAQAVVFHEVYGHKGMRAILPGEQYTEMMTRIRRANPKIARAADAWYEQYGIDSIMMYRDSGMTNAEAVRTVELLAVEEALADMASTVPIAGPVRKLLAALQAGLRKIGLHTVADWMEGRSESETFALLAAARAAVVGQVRQRGVHVAPTSAVPSFARGQMAPQHQVPLGLQGGATAGPRWQAPDPTRMDRLVYELQNRQIDLKRVQATIRETVGAIPQQFDAYLKEEVYHGRVATRTSKFLERELRPLIEDMRQRNVSMDQLEAFLWARHAPERNAQIAKINPDYPDGGSGLTDKQAADYMAGADVKDSAGEIIIKGLDQSKLQDMQDLAARVDRMTAGTNQILIQYGLEDSATIAAWTGTYQHYVPLKREDMDGVTPIGQGFSVKGSASKRALGSSRKVTDILANIALAREAAITRGEKNRVTLSLYGLALTNPNPEFWTTDKPPIIKAIDPKTGLVVKRPDPSYKNKDNVVVLRVRGEDRVIAFNERDPRAMRVAETMKNLDVQPFGEIMGAVASATRFLAAINTQYNPVFGLLNAVRDVQAAALNLSTTPIADKRAFVLANAPAALRAIWQAERHGNMASPWAKLYDQLQLAGGTTGYREIFRVGKDRSEALQREIDALDRKAPRRVLDYMLNWLDHYNTAIENAIRVTAFKAALDKGMTEERAASVAKNLTVNFNRKGRLGREMGAMYAFFNAAVQGTARMLQTLDPRTTHGKVILTGGIMVGVVQALVGAAAMDDDDWESIPEFTKQRNFIIPLGESYAMIPMPLGFNVLPNIGRIVAEAIATGGANWRKQVPELLAVLLDNANPMGSGTFAQILAPTVADPIIALAENKDFTGRPIFKEDANAMRPKPGFQRSRDTASTVSKGIAYGANWATGGTDYTPGLVSPTPDQLDYLFGTITGGLGRELNKVYQTAELTAKGKDVPEYKKPIIGRFYGDFEGDANAASRYWAVVREVNEKRNELAGRQKDGGDVSGYLAAHPELRLIKTIEKTQSALAKLNKAKDQIEMNPNLREADRTAQMDAIDQQMVKTMEAVTSMAREAKKK